MRRHILSLGLLFVVVVGFFVTALPTTSFAESGVPTEEWSQGQFALWLVKAAGALSKLPPAGTGTDATNFLSRLGVVPEGGWKKDEKITKEFLLSLLGDDSKDAANLSFDDLIKRIQDRVNLLVSQWHEGFFSANQANATAAATP